MPSVGGRGGSPDAATDGLVAQRTVHDAEGTVPRADADVGDARCWIAAPCSYGRQGACGRPGQAWIRAPRAV